jgi:hypothetical protein
MSDIRARINGDRLTFYNLNAQAVGAEPQGTTQQALQELDMTIIAQLQAKIDALQSQLNGLQAELDDLIPASVGLSNISQDSQGKILLNADSRIEGLLSVFPKLEVRNNSVNSYFYPWSETSKLSARIDILTQDPSKEYEISIFRDTICTNVRAGLSVYRPNQTNTINAFLAGSGNSFIAVNNGNFGVGTITPSYKLHVVGSSGFTGNIGFFGRAPIAQQAGGVKTASAMYGANEQTMLQIAYSCLRNLGFLT